jgi:hypothetical protein
VLEDFRVGTFYGHLGDSFRVYGDDPGTLDLELVSATELAESSGRPFSIVFRGPRDAPLHQRIQRMDHEQIGAFDIFLSGGKP